MHPTPKKCAPRMRLKISGVSFTILLTRANRAGRSGLTKDWDFRAEKEAEFQDDFMQASGIGQKCKQVSELVLAHTVKFLLNPSPWPRQIKAEC